MHSAVVRIKVLTLVLGALMLAVNISLFCFVQYNILKLHMYKPEPFVRAAHYVAEVAAVLNCLMCFFDCYVVCFERAHSRRHVKAFIYAMLSAVIFVSNSGSYFYITNGHSAGKYLKTLSHFQSLSHCCGVTSYVDYTTLGLPIPPTCECKKESLLKIVRCTRGRKITAGVARAIGSETPGNTNGTARAGSSYYELKKSVFKSGCEEDRARCEHVLTGMLRLLVSSVSLQFLSLLFIPLPWLYEK